MYNVFNVTHVTTDFTNKLVNIKFNFSVDSSTVNKKSVNIIDTSSGLPVTYKLNVKEDVVTIILKDWPVLNLEYVINIDGVKDKLNRELNHSLSKVVIFKSDTKLKTIITCPNNNEAVQKLHNLIYFSIKAIGEDGKDIVNPMPEINIPELPTGNDLEAMLEDESEVIYHFEFASDIAFFDVVKDYKSKYSDGNIELDNGQYYMRARVIENETDISDWSEVITFTVVPDKCEDLLTEEDNKYINDLMAPIDFFIEDDTKFEVESYSSNGKTHEIVFIELSKDIDVTKLPQTIIAYRRDL